MLKQPITVQVNTTVAGPHGYKIRAGKVVELEDSSYTRLLVDSGTVSLIDPASLDPEFLERAGYELRDGYSYQEKEISEDVVKKIPDAYLTKIPKKSISAPKKAIDSKENSTETKSLKEETST